VFIKGDIFSDFYNFILIFQAGEKVNEKWRRTAHGSDILKRKGYHENQCIEVHPIIRLMNMDSSHRKTSKHYLYQVCFFSSLSLFFYFISFFRNILIGIGDKKSGKDDPRTGDCGVGWIHKLYHSTQYFVFIKVYIFSDFYNFILIFQAGEKVNEKWRRTAHGSDILKRKGYHENQCIEVHRIIRLMNMDSSHRKTSKHYLYQVCFFSSLSFFFYFISFFRNILIGIGDKKVGKMILEQGIAVLVGFINYTIRLSTTRSSWGIFFQIFIILF
jgi:hypothetical protein